MTRVLLGVAQFGRKDKRVELRILWHIGVVPHMSWQAESVQRTKLALVCVSFPDVLVVGVGLFIAKDTREVVSATL